MTLAITNGTTFQFNDWPGPRFHLVVTLSAPWSGPNTSFTAQIQADNGQQLTAYFVGPAADGVTYTADATGGYYAIGARTVTATLTNPTASPPIISNPVHFTITKRSWTFGCGMGTLLPPGQATQVTLTAQSVDGSYPLVWSEGTATVWLVGPSTVTYANLQPDSSGVVSITTPAQIGWYALNCSFTGTPYYAPEQVNFTYKNILISQMRQLGGVQLYTNPQTLVANQATQMLVVFKPVPGQPTPTGEFNITLNSNPLIYTQSIKIAPDGTASLTLAAVANLYGATTITLHYFGDPTFNDQSVHFPMTNPAIPGSGGGSGPGQATATANPTVSPTGAASVTSSAIATASPLASPTQQTGGGGQGQGSAGPLAGGGLLAVVVALGLLVMGVAGAYVLRRRGANPRRAEALFSLTKEPPAHSGS
jgi:hypothetical protein